MAGPLPIAAHKVGEASTEIGSFYLAEILGLREYLDEVHYRKFGLRFAFRIRDFRGLPTSSFDGSGNYSVGIKEQMVFPEIDYDDIERIHGMDITMVTTAGRDDLGKALLRELGMPFRGDTPVVI